MTEYLIVFDEKSIRDEKAHPKEFLEKLSSINNRAYNYLLLEDLVFHIDESDTNVYLADHEINLEQVKKVYFRRWQNNPSLAFSFSRYLSSKNIKFYDTEVSSIQSLDKSNQMMKLATQGIRVPATLFCGGSDKSKTKLLNIAKEKFSFPLIAKSVSGTRGSDNFLVSTIENLEDILKSRDDIFLIQEYIENQCDYRLWVTGDECHLIIRRTRTEGHLNNTSQGASSDIVDLDELSTNAIGDSIKAAKIMKRDIAGVDILISQNNQHYVLEVNRAPQVEFTKFDDEKYKILAEYIEKLT